MAEIVQPCQTGCCVKGLDMRGLPVKGLHCDTELRCCEECEDVCMARRQSNSKNDLKNKETSQAMKMLITVKALVLHGRVYSLVVDWVKACFSFLKILGHLKVCSH